MRQPLSNLVFLYKVQFSIVCPILGYRGAGGLGAEKGGMQAFLEDQKMK